MYIIIPYNDKYFNMKRSILHKETFTTRNTDVSSYLDDMVINEETLQLDEGLLSLIPKFFRTLGGGRGGWTGLKRAGLVGGGLTAGKYGLDFTNALKQKGADLMDPESWTDAALGIGLTTAAGLAVYNLFKNWMANKEETKRQQQARA